MSIFSKKKPREEEMTSYSPGMEYPTPREAVIDGIQRATEGFGGLIYNPEQQAPQMPVQQQPKPMPMPVAPQQPQVQRISDNDIIEAFQEMSALIEVQKQDIEALKLRMTRRGL